MSYQGIDTAARISAAGAKKLKQEGVAFVGRYLVPESYGKALTAQEATSLRDAGLAILLVWETIARRMKGGAAAGAADALQAKTLADKLGTPKGTCIYFAADWQVRSEELAACEEYMKAARFTLCDQYEAGAYGPELIVRHLSTRGVCGKFWQCVAWSNQFLNAANVRQYQYQGGAEAKALAAKVGFAVDMNACEDLRAAGLWLPTYEKYEEDDGGAIYTAPQQSTAQPWYAEAMTWAAEAGLIRDGRPTDTVTQAEMAKVLHCFDQRIEKKIAEAIKLRLPEDDSAGGLISD